jgi:phosphoserine phosphatase
LTGKYLGDIVDGPKKDLKAIAEKKAHINQTIAVGDGANDLPMLNLAGNCFSCQSNGENASSSISSLGLDGVCTF